MVRAGSGDCFRRERPLPLSQLTGVTVTPASSRPLIILAALTAAGGCATSPASVSMAGAPAPTPDMSVTAPTPDPRVGLAPGLWNAATAAWNIRLVSTTPASPQFINRSDPGDPNYWNSDLAFSGNYVIQG